MSKLVSIKTYEVFKSLWDNNNINELSLNFIVDTQQLYTHGMFINSATFGTENSNTIPLTIAGISKTLALSGHTHSNYYDKTANLDIGNYSIVSGNNEFLKATGGSLYLGNVSNPTYISGNHLYSIRGQNTYTILDTGNFEVTNKDSNGYTYYNKAIIKYGTSFEIDYVKRDNSLTSLDNLHNYTSAGTTKVNNVTYGFITLRTDTEFSNPSWAQLRIDIPGQTVQFRTSVNPDNWKDLTVPTISQNALNVAGIVKAPSSSTTNKVWKTDENGNPDWRDDTNVWTAMTGATSSANGTVGYVNAVPPKDGYNTKFLRADGTWSVPAYPTKSSWNYDDMYVSSLTTSGNSLRWVKNGSNNDITIPYATSAEQATTATNLANAPELLIGTGNNVNKIAVKAGEKTSSYITVSYATNSNYSSDSNKAYELWTPPTVTSRPSSIDELNCSAAPASGGRVGMRLDIVSSSLTTNIPNSGSDAAGYALTWCWDYGTGAAKSQLYIPNGDHINPTLDHVQVRGLATNGTWGPWQNLAYYNDISFVGDTRYVQLTKATQTITGSLIVTGGQMSIGCQVGDTTYGKYHSLYMGYHGIDHMDFYEGQFNFYANGGGTPTLKVNGSTIWHAGNDGSGSGLDADLLDGQHGSYYSPTTHTHSVQINGNNYTIPKSGDSAVNLGKYHPWTTTSSIAMDTISAGWYDCSVVPSGTPVSNHGSVIAVTNVGTPFQLYIPDSSHAYIYKRYKSGGTWYGWFKLSAGYADSAGSATSATNATYAGIAYELHSPTSVTGRLSSIDVVPSNDSSGRTRMRIDLVTSSLTSGIPNSSVDAAGYVTTFGWDNSTVYAASQFYIPNGDHITRGDRVQVRGNDNGTWSGWYNLAYYSDIQSVGDDRYVKKSGDTMTGTLIVNAGSSKFGPSLNDSTYKYYHALYLGTHGDDYMYFYERDFLFCYNGGSAQFKIEGSTSKVTSVHNIYAPNFYTTSDRSKKQNISSFSEHIRKFQLKDTEKWHYGVIAQEVPEMFREGKEGNMTVNYNSVLSYYVGQLENRVRELENEIQKLKSK